MQVQFSQNLGPVTLFRLHPDFSNVDALGVVISDLQPRKTILFPQPNGSKNALGMALFCKKGVYLMDNMNVLIQDKSPKTLVFLNSLLNCRSNVLLVSRPLEGLSGLTLIESFGFICHAPAAPLSDSLLLFKQMFDLPSLSVRGKSAATSQTMAVGG
jgi:hypothetical protein